MIGFVWACLACTNYGHSLRISVESGQPVARPVHAFAHEKAKATTSVQNIAALLLSSSDPACAFVSTSLGGFCHMGHLRSAGLHSMVSKDGQHQLGHRHLFACGRRIYQTRAPTASKLRVQNLHMFDGIPPPPPVEEDVFESMAKKTTPLQRAVKPVPPEIFSLATGALTPVFGVASCFANPFYEPRTKVAVGVVGGAVGEKIKRTLMGARRKAFPAALAQHILDTGSGFEELKPHLARRVGRWHLIDEDGIRVHFKDMFQHLLHELICEDGAPTISHVSQLLALRKGLGLFWYEVQDVFHSEARSLLNGEEPPKESQMTKPFLELIWLSRVMFSTSVGKVTNEILVSEILMLSDEAAQRAVDRVASIVYREAIEKAVMKYQEIGEAKTALESAAATLCMSEGAVAGLTAQVFGEQVELLLNVDQRLLEKFRRFLNIDVTKSRRYAERCLNIAIQDMAQGRGDKAFEEVARVLNYCNFVSSLNAAKDFQGLTLEGSDQVKKTLAQVASEAYPENKDLLQAIF